MPLSKQNRSSSSSMKPLFTLTGVTGLIGFIFILFFSFGIYYVASWQNPIRDYISGKYPNEVGFSHMIRTNISESERRQCQNILDIYDNQSIEWPELDSLFADGDKKKWRFTFDSAQSMQDWFLFSSIFRSMYTNGQSGVYLDCAAHAPKKISNTWFYDRCLGWDGVCVEAEPRLIGELRKHRNCKIVDTCVWSEPKNLTFTRAPNKACSGLKDYNKASECSTKGKNATEIAMQCTTLSKIISDSGFTHIDYLSLDIEGAEARALMGLDFSSVRIDVFTVEVNDANINDNLDVMTILTDNGYLPKFLLPHTDMVFIHRNATDKIAAIDNWIATVPWQNRIKQRFGPV